MAYRMVKVADSIRVGVNRAGQVNIEFTKVAGENVFQGEADVFLTPEDAKALADHLHQIVR